MVLGSDVANIAGFGPGGAPGFHLQAALVTVFLAPPSRSGNWSAVFGGGPGCRGGHSTPAGHGSGRGGRDGRNTIYLVDQREPARRTSSGCGSIYVAGRACVGSATGMKWETGDSRRKFSAVWWKPVRPLFGVVGTGEVSPRRLPTVKPPDGSPSLHPISGRGFLRSPVG